MLSAAIQILAFALALLGVLGTTVATILPNWKVSINSWSSILTPISQMQGLWMDCVWYNSGVFSCTIKNSVLSLPAYLVATRAAMVLSCMVASFGLCLASLGLKCTRWGGSRRAKGHTAIAAGACFVLASFLCLVPASWFTNEVITTFLTTDLPESSRYQPGGALCVTFISAGFLLAGGVIFCLSCPGNRSSQQATDFYAAASSSPPTQPSAPPLADAQTQDRFVLFHQRKHVVNKRQNNSEMDKKNGEFARKVKMRPSPCKLHPPPPPKDLRDSYCLQEYV